MKKKYLGVFIGIAVLIGFTVCCFAVDKAPFIYNDNNKRDPFWPLVNDQGMTQNYDKGSAVMDISLEGIIVDKSGNNLAIINGQVVKANDSVNVYKIEKILPDKVVLSRGTQTFELILNKEE